jgi:RND family efflux transporter MFP subunit
MAVRNHVPVFLLLLGAAVLPAGLAACQPDAPWSPTVRTVHAARSMITKKVQFSGAFAPDRTVDVFAQVSGVATFVGPEVGDHVTKGELLAKIDAQELAARLKEAEARLQGVRDKAAQADIAVGAARLNLDLAQRAYNRTKTLMQNEIVTKSRLDDARTRLEIARDAFDTARQQYRTLTRSGVAQAEAQVKTITVLISESAIVSPMDGVVADRRINPGELATPARPLMTLVDTNRLKLQGDLWQGDVVHLSVGDPVVISVDALPGRKYAGTVAQVGPVAAATGQYFPVVADVKNDGELLAGMTAKATLTFKSARSVIVPLSAVGRDTEDHPFVFLVSGGEVHRKAVTLGMSNGASVQVLAGLSAGQTIADSDVQSLQDGMIVRVAAGKETG